MTVLEDGPGHGAPRRLAAIAIATTAPTATMLVLALTWLGVVARGLYESSLGPIDIGWGVVLTAVAGIVGKLVYDSLHEDDGVERAR